MAEVDARRAANGLAVLAEMLGLTTPRGVCSQVLHRSAVKHATGNKHGKPPMPEAALEALGVIQSWYVR